MQGTCACWATIVDEILSPSERIADPGGPIKMIFFGEAASDSGSLGFSDAWPLVQLMSAMSCIRSRTVKNLPSCPHGVHVHALCNIHNELHVGVVVVVRAAGHL